MLTIGIISDLHAGDKTEADEFTLDDKQMIGFLSQCIEQYDTVILNGDVFECWHPKSWNEQVQQFNRIARARPELHEFIVTNVTSGKLIYINGNHDAVVRVKKLIPNVVKEYVVELPTQTAGVTSRILIQHGHQGDMMNHGPISIIGMTIAWCVGWLERWGWKDADSDLSKLEKTIIPGGGSDNSLDDYAKFKINEGFDLVILGHTHEATSASYTRSDNNSVGHYWNTGKAMTAPFTFTEVIVDKNLNISVKQVDVS